MSGAHDGKSAETRNLRPGELSSGTTIIAIPFPGGVVLGADSRVSTGTYVANRVSDKIAQLHDHIWCCRSGSGRRCIAPSTRHRAAVTKATLSSAGKRCMCGSRQASSATATQITSRGDRLGSDLGSSRSEIYGTHGVRVVVAV